MKDKNDAIKDSQKENVQEHKSAYAIFQADEESRQRRRLISRKFEGKPIRPVTHIQG